MYPRVSLMLSWITNSQPIYFDEYPYPTQLVHNKYYTSQNGTETCPYAPSGVSSIGDVLPPGVPTPPPDPDLVPELPGLPDIPDLTPTP